MAYLGVKPAAITSATQAEIAGDLTVDTNTLVVDAANNRVGVGTASPAVNLDIVEDSASTDAILGITAGTGGRAQIRSEAQSDGTSSVLSFHTMSSSNTSEVGRWLAGGGLTFNGDTAAANALNDYEEGSWTPEIRNADNDNTFTTESGKYIKIGAVVVAYFINDGGNTGGGGGLQVRGLPFNSTNTAHIFGARGTAAVNNSSSTVRRNLIVNFNSGNSNSALLYYGGDFLSDTLTYVSGFIVYQTDS